METTSELRRESLPIMPAQAWILELSSPRPNENNLVEVLEVSLPFDADAAFLATEKLMRRHEAFGLRFVKTGEGWEQRSGAAPNPEQAFTAHDISLTPQDRRMAAVSEVIDEGFRSQNLAEGPLFQIHFFYTGLGSPSIVALIAHHLIADYTSMQIIVSEFFNIVSSEDGFINDPSTITQFSAVARHTSRLANDARLVSDASYWLSNEKLCRYDIDFGANVPGPQPGRNFANMKLDATETATLLRNLRQAHRATIETAVIAAFASSVRDRSGDAEIAVNLWNHGRLSYGDLDLSRTIGLVAYRYRAFLDLGAQQSPSVLMKSVHQQLARVPRNGIGYGLLRYGSNEHIRNVLSAPTEGIGINFFGRIEPAANSFFFLKRISDLSNLVIGKANKQHNTMRFFGRLSNDLYLEIMYRDTHKPENVNAMLGHIRSFLQELSC